MGNSALWVLAWIDTTPLAGLAGAVASHCPLGGAWREPAGPPPLPTPPFPPLQALPLALSWCDFQGRGAAAAGEALPPTRGALWGGSSSLSPLLWF